MVLTDSEKILLMDTSLDNLKSGGDGILLTEKEYEWMLGSTKCINIGYFRSTSSYLDLESLKNIDEESLNNTSNDKSSINLQNQKNCIRGSCRPGSNLPKI